MCACVCPSVCVVGVTTGMLSAPLLLHSKEFKYVNEMSEFPLYNGMCPLVVSQMYHYRIGSPCPRTQPDLKKSKVCGVRVGCVSCKGQLAPTCVLTVLSPTVLLVCLWAQNLH